MRRRTGEPILKRAKGVYPVGARHAVALQLMDLLSCDEGKRLVANLSRVRTTTLDETIELAALAEFLTGRLLP